MRPARLVPWLLLVASVSVLPALRALADPVPDLPPRLDFPAQTGALESAGDPGALVQAALLRRALGEPDRAGADIDRYLSLLAAEPGRAAAAADPFVTELLDPETWPDPARWQATLRRFLAATKNATSTTLQSARVRAEVLLAAHLWQTSCTLAPAQRSDVACIQRIDAKAERRAIREVGRRGGTSHSFERDFCEPSNRYRYVVHPRRAATAGEAQSLLTQALRRARALTKILPQDAALREASAHALFLQSEPRFETALAYRLPPAFQAELARLPTQRPSRQDAFLRSWSETWLSARTNMSISLHRPAVREPAVREQPFYRAVVELGVPAWTVAAYARLAQLSLNFTDQWARAFPTPIQPLPPTPPGLDPSEWPMLYQDARCSLGSEDLLLESETRAAIDGCDAEARRAGLDTPYLRTCFALHHRPLDINEAKETFAAPTWHAPLAQARSGLASSRE